MQPLHLPVQTLSPGCLYIVATPIGNLNDITLRALALLHQVDMIAAEDTRHSKRLLSAYDIHTPLVAYHAHNEKQAAEKLITQLQAGKTIALISDAGTPLVSDPGYNLVVAAVAQGISVQTAPGPCAAIAALSIAGLPCDKFCFEGFLPVKDAARTAHLKALENETRTIIFYEAPHRVKAMLTTLNQVLPERKLVVTRELTKQFESMYTGTAEHLLAQIDSGTLPLKGEWVILMAGAPAVNEDTETVSITVEVLLKNLLAHTSVKTAAQLASQLTGKPKNELYKWALNLQQNN